MVDNTSTQNTWHKGALQQPTQAELVPSYLSEPSTPPSASTSTIKSLGSIRTSLVASGKSVDCDLSQDYIRT